MGSQPVKKFERDEIAAITACLDDALDEDTSEGGKYLRYFAQKALEVLVSQGHLASFGEDDHWEAVKKAVEEYKVSLS